MNSLKVRAGHSGLEQKLLESIAKINDGIESFDDEFLAKEKNQKKEQIVSIEDLVDCVNEKVAELLDMTHKKMKRYYLIL